MPYIDWRKSEVRMSVDLALSTRVMLAGSPKQNSLSSLVGRHTRLIWLGTEVDPFTLPGPECWGMLNGLHAICSTLPWHEFMIVVPQMDSLVYSLGNVTVGLRASTLENLKVASARAGSMRAHGAKVVLILEDPKEPIPREVAHGFNGVVMRFTGNHALWGSPIIDDLEAELAVEGIPYLVECQPNPGEHLITDGHFYCLFDKDSK